MIPTTWSSGKSKNVCDCQRLREGREEQNRWSAKDFEDSENTLFNIKMEDSYHYTFAHTHRERTTPTVTPTVNYGLREIMTCQ